MGACRTWFGDSPSRHRIPIPNPPGNIPLLDVHISGVSATRRTSVSAGSPPSRSDRAAPLFVGAMPSRSTDRQVRMPCGHFGERGLEPRAGDVRFGQAPFWARRPLFVERSGPEGVIDFGITGGTQRFHGRCRPRGHRNTRQHAQLPMRKQSTHGPVARHGPRHRVTAEETAHRTSYGLRRWSRRGWTLSARSLDCYRLLESVP
jgi:hypothetical protein